jgi:hypothetical protein
MKPSGNPPTVIQDEILQKRREQQGEEPKPELPPEEESISEEIDLTPERSKVDVRELNHPHAPGFKLQLHQLVEKRPLVESVVLTDADGGKVLIVLRYTSTNVTREIVGSVEDAVTWMRKTLEIDA